MAEFKVEGSGGYVIAELTEEQAKKADLGHPCNSHNFIKGLHHSWNLI